MYDLYVHVTGLKVIYLEFIETPKTARNILLFLKQLRYNGSENRNEIREILSFIDF